MSIYLSVDHRKEIKERISEINRIRENYKDAKAEYEELIKMDPNTKSKGSGDYHECAAHPDEQTDKIISMSMRREALYKRINEYKAIIGDFDRGWNRLNDKEKDILSKRYMQHMKQETIAKNSTMDRKTVYNIEMTALRKMESELLKI